VLEIHIGDHFAYLHYIGRHPHYGDAVLVSPVVHQRRTSVTADVFSDSYVAFYPVAAAVSQGLVVVVAHWLPPSLPIRLRRAGVRSGHRVETWIIEDGAQEVVKSVLSDDDLQLPIAAIWNHELLVQRIAQGWIPAHEGGDGMNNDAHAVREVVPASGRTPEPHRISHYLYVPTRDDAGRAAEALRRSGFETDERRGADGVNWLVLARHTAVPTEELMASLRRSMETLVAKVGGEYDGWEAEIQHRGQRTR
jgi:hypothetical protein